RLMCALLAAVVLASAAAAWAADAEILEHKGRWESGYGSTRYNVVGRVKNTSGHALRWVRLRIDALDATRQVVASTVTDNESAEVLPVPEAKPEALVKAGKVKTLDAGAEERFRGSFLKEETPPFKDYTVTVTETPKAN